MLPLYKQKIGLMFLDKYIVNFCTMPTKHGSTGIVCCCSVVKSSLTLWPHGLQHARLPCPSLSPGVCSKSCPLSWWSYLTISSSAAHFSFCLHSFPASGSFPMSWFFASGGQSNIFSKVDSTTKVSKNSNFIYIFIYLYQRTNSNMLCINSSNSFSGFCSHLRRLIETSSRCHLKKR